MSGVSFVLDASVALAWCFEDEAIPAADKVLEYLRGSKAIVPGLWFLEVGNALLSAERRGRLTPAESVHFLGLLCQLPIQVEELSPRQAWEEILSLARIYRLSTYDAVYLALAIRRGLPLASLDGDLCRAAAECGVQTLVDIYSTTSA